MNKEAFKVRMGEEIDLRNTFDCGSEDEQLEALKSLQWSHLGHQILAYKSKFVKIRAILAMRPDLDPTIQELLMMDPRPYIKLRLADNKHLEEKHLYQLTKNRNPLITALAEKNSQR